MILNFSKLKPFAKQQSKCCQNNEFCLRWVENIEGKGENAGYQHFLLFPQCFQKTSSLGLLKDLISPLQSIKVINS